MTTTTFILIVLAISAATVAYITQRRRSEAQETREMERMVERQQTRQAERSR